MFGHHKQRITLGKERVNELLAAVQKRLPKFGAEERQNA